MARGRNRGTRRANAAPSSSASGESEDDTVNFDPDKLSIVVEGQSQSFSQWTLDYACHYYPDVGQKTYRVPPVDFNTQELIDDVQLGFSELIAPKEENRKKDRSQADVGWRLEELGRRLEDSTGHGLFIVSSAHYDNYLSDLKELRTKGKLPPLPKEVTQRGELDILVLHAQQGVVLVQVKGVGFRDSWEPTQAELQDAVRKKVEEALRQLTRDVKVLQHVMADLHLTCDLHRVVALPFVSGSLLQASLSGTGMGGDEGEVVYLCADQVASPEAMWAWWEERIVRQGSSPLQDLQLKGIVGRYCGLLSTVSVWCKSSLRMEVRDVAEAVHEVGDRFAHLVLTANQRKALDSTQSHVFLHGPPGTGKSVLLVIKARQWLLQGHDVLVLNVDFGRPGNPVGHYIHDSITQWLLKMSREESASPGPGRASAGRSRPCSSSALRGKRSKGAKRRVADGGTSSHKSTSDSHLTSRVDSPDTVNPTLPPERGTSKGKTGDVDLGSSEADTATSSCSASLSSSSDAESTRPQNLGQVFRLDFDLGINVGDGQAQQKVQELLQLVRQTVRPGVPCHFLVDEFYWKGRLVPVVEELRGQYPDSAVWCAEVSGDTIPKGFTPAMLKTVLRCPPSVQALLKVVDWTQGHRGLYHDDSTLKGLPTDGFKPTLLEHRHHPALSPLDCVHCADNLLTFFREELKLDFGQGSSPVPPSQGPPPDDSPSGACSATHQSMTSTVPAEDSPGTEQHPQEKKRLPVPKTKKKRTHSLPRRVKFTDITVLFSYPQQCMNRTQNLLLIEDKPQDIHHDNIENSVFLGRMKEAGLPVVFRAPNSDAREIALPTEDRVLFSVTNAVTGLERKVVVYIPCESTAYQYPVTRRQGPPASPPTTAPSSAAAQADQAGQAAPCRSSSGAEERVHQNAALGNPGPGDGAEALVVSSDQNTATPSVGVQDAPTEGGGPGCPRCPQAAQNLDVSAGGDGANHDDDPATLCHAVSEEMREDGDDCRNPVPSNAMGVQSTWAPAQQRLCIPKPESESNSAITIPPNENRADALTTPMKNQANTCTVCMENQANTSAVSMESQANTNTVPMESQANTNTVPMESQANTNTVPMESQANTNTVPMKSQANSDTVSMENQANTSAVSMESQANTNTVPMESQANTNTVPMESQANSDTVSMESEANTNRTSMESQADASAVTQEAARSVPAGLCGEDWAKINERLLEQNQKGLFYAASRCLSVFVLIIP